MDDTEKYLAFLIANLEAIRGVAEVGVSIYDSCIEESYEIPRSMEGRLVAALDNQAAGKIVLDWTKDGLLGSVTMHNINK